MLQRGLLKSLLIASSLALACARGPSRSDEVGVCSNDKKETRGRVRVTKIVPRDRNYTDVDVFFDFAPEGHDFEQSPNYRVLLAGTFLPRDVQVGAEHPATKYEEGPPCTPLFFRIQWCADGSESLPCGRITH